MTISGSAYERLDCLCCLTGLPLIIKGIRYTFYATLQADYGVDPIIVSNHLGRQPDGTTSSIESLPAIAEAAGDRLEVYMDSGFRRGMDVVKAPWLGARAVPMGRPVFWGLSYNGSDGVRDMLDTRSRSTLLRRLDMRGVTNVAQRR